MVAFRPAAAPVFYRRMALLIGLFLVGCSAWLLTPAKPSEPRKIALLVSENSDPNAINMWCQSASEEGVKLEPLTANEFLRPIEGANKSYAGVIIPDTIHTRGNSLLTDAVRDYVRRGGKLMLVFDALTLDLGGAYPAGRARLSDLAGVDYAMYARLGDNTTGLQAVGASANTVDKLDITPGRYTVGQPVASGGQAYDRWLTTYHYGVLHYPFFVTSAPRASSRVSLMTAGGSVAATEQAFGKGAVLFVNLPLGLLKQRTDGLLLHSFLRYFSDQLVGLPRLLSTPGGVGGLVLNIHVDSRSAIHQLEFLRDIGMFQQGPYSIHFTAGPDVNHPGDKLGMDVERNPAAQTWIRELHAQGHAIGNHGGWIHNYFAEHLNDTNRTDFEKYLTLNDEALKKIIGEPLFEYAAPEGHHPLWVNDWLAEHGMLATYTTANGGAGPQRGLHANGSVDGRVWTFPVTTYGSVASFEEASFSHVPKEAVSGWLQDVVQYVTDKKNIRMIYCHPFGARFYPEAVAAMLKTSAAAQHDGRFHWYTMTDVARFMSRREQVSWQIESDRGDLRVSAMHPASLHDMTWHIADRNCARPKVVRGTARITRSQSDWEVVAGDVKTLVVSCGSSTG